MIRRLLANLRLALCVLIVAAGPSHAQAAVQTQAGPYYTLYWILGILLIAFVLYRMHRTGQSVNLRGVMTVRTILGILLLVAVYLVCSWAVRKFTAPGDMSVMEPPVGAVPAAVMAARREPIAATVSYTGTAVPFVDQEVTPRVTGSIVWMPLYPGDRVSRGQVVARLDTSELGSRVNEQAANVTMAEHETAIARMQAQQARNAAAQAQAQVGEARDDVANAKSDLSAARQDVTAAEAERTSTQADLESAQTGMEDAQAQFAAAQADQQYWQAQIKRSAALVKSGAISQQEYEQDRSQAANADAKVRQAQARLQQVNAGIRATQSRLDKA